MMVLYVRHTPFFCRKPELISYQELGHPNSFETFLHCWSLPCFKNLGGECTVFYYFAKVFAALLLCWAIPSIITLLRYTLPQYIAELYPMLTHCCGISNLNHCWVIPSLMHWWDIPNFRTLLRCTLSYYIAELFLNL